MDSMLTGYEVSYVDDDYWKGVSRSIMIVEDHQIVRDGMRKLIREVLEGVAVEFFEASSLDEARQIIGKCKEEIDLVLLDIYLPDADPADAVECLKLEWSGLPVVVLTACEEWDLAADFLKAGALGYIPKSSNVGVISNVLRLIFSGGRYFPPQVFGALAAASGEAPVEGRGGASHVEQAQVFMHHSDTELSPRQREVKALMLQGLSNKEIARELGVSLGTAKNYVAAVLRVFKASTRAKAMKAALSEESAAGPVAIVEVAT